MTETAAKANTDREIYRETAPDCFDFASPSIHVTMGGGIGINVGGDVIVMTIRTWHKAAKLMMSIPDNE